ncbi:histone deacetylase family protein [Neisseria weixii]|uniref:histone deacetylase family protein n=1 Tax=Neisseria weixii TaxID=1853276 RepID=UPI003613BC56
MNPLLTRLIQRIRTRLRRLIGKNARTVWISHPIFTQSRPDTHHPESPQRISAIEAALKAENIWPRLQKTVAPEINDSRLALVHPRNYLRFLESVQPQPGKIYRVDDDTVISHQSLEAARFAAGALIKAVDMVIQKKAHHAFCAARPPGHHAQSNRAGGFCIINNIAVAAMHAIAEHRLQRIAIIDFDAHHADGTLEIFKDDPRIMLLDSFEADIFPFPKENIPTGRNPHIVHTPLKAGTDSRRFRTVIREQWLPKLKQFKPELVLISAGFDGHKQDQTSYLNLHEADYAWLTHKIIQTASSCPGRIVSALEGGYTSESLGKSAAAHIRVLAGMRKAAYVTEYQKQLKH